MEKENIEQKIKDYLIQKCNVDKVGIAGMGRFNEAPEGFHPTDFLPGCKSVIAFCCRIPDGVISAAFRAFEDGLYNLHGIYGAYGYSGGPNFTLHFASFKGALFIEELTGCTTAPVTSGPLQGAKMLSMRHAAVAAGLGEFGWHSIVITPEFGTRNRFGAILTTAELEPDPLYNGPKLCDPEKCHVCSSMCPTGAIHPYCYEQARIIKMDDKEMRYGSTSWPKCRLMCHGLYAEWNPSHENLVDPSNTHPTNLEVDPIAKGFYSNNPEMDYPQHNPTWKCGNCLLYCPVGNWKERFYDTGLSHVNIAKFIDT